MLISILIFYDIKLFCHRRHAFSSKCCIFQRLQVTCLIMLPYAAGETRVSCQLHTCCSRRRSCVLFLDPFRCMSKCSLGKLLL